MTPERRRSFAITNVLALAMLVGCDKPALNEPGRVSEPTGRFSLVVPSGWAWKEIPGFKYKFVIGPARDGFAPNINFIEEDFKGSVEEYATASLGFVSAQMPGARILGREPIATSGGLNGVRAVCENQQNGIQLRQTWYFLGDSTRRFVITCSALATGGEALDPVFETTLKTFRFD